MDTIIGGKLCAFPLTSLQTKGEKPMTKEKTTRLAKKESKEIRSTIEIDKKLFSVRSSFGHDNVADLLLNVVRESMSEAGQLI
jgi:N-acetylmuramoyl-L-alanine amidase CwlA